jgi:hypothetical protein
VTDQPLRGDNHYVSCTYLKRWASSDNRIWTYRTLVTSPKVPFWRTHGLTKVAYHQHLYTRVIAGQETDTFEKWLAEEFEAPAAEALEKATSEARLTPDDWKRLIRYLAAQQVRTPRWYAAQVKRWYKSLPEDINAALQSMLQSLQEPVPSELPPARAIPEVDHGLPWRLQVRRDSEQNIVQLGAEVFVGRALWLWSIQRVLERIVKVLYRHRWTILLPPKSVVWFTSDDPVVPLNRSADGMTYTFDGGWGPSGTAIFMPLGPQHLLYTEIGQRPPLRGSRVPPDLARFVRRCIAAHAHRWIFAMNCDADIPQLRPRRVDAEVFRQEQEWWQQWPAQQMAAEQELWESTKQGHNVGVHTRFVQKLSLTYYTHN